MAAAPAPSKLTGRFGRAVVVEDNDVLCRALVRFIGSWDAEVSAGASVQAALPLLVAPLDLVVCDVRLPDGSARAVFEHAVLIEPRPLLFAISGRATASEGFELARIGVHGFLAKPFKLAEFECAIECALEEREARASRPGALSAQTRRSLEAQLLRFADTNGLSDQQAQVLRLLLFGVSRKELPSALGVSENTCKTLIRRLLARCDAERLTDLVRELMARSAEAPSRARPDSRDLS
jgi:DNA-binding NarL/FixJ family response regulator